MANRKLLSALLWSDSTKYNFAISSAVSGGSGALDRLDLSWPILVIAIAMSIVSPDLFLDAAPLLRVFGRFRKSAVLRGLAVDSVEEREAFGGGLSRSLDGGTRGVAANPTPPWALWGEPPSFFRWGVAAPFERFLPEHCGVFAVPCGDYPRNKEDCHE